MTKPLLTYDIKTTPMPVEVSQGVTISIVASNAGNSYVSLSEIQFKLSAKGVAGTDLSNDQANVPTSSSQTGWDISQDKSTFSITPNSSASGTVPPKDIGEEGLSFNFGPIPVNDMPGTATVKIRENSGGVWSDWVSFPISKWPEEFKFSDFKATHASVPVGSTAELTWNVSGPHELTLQYQGITVPSPTSPFRTQGLGSSTVFTLTATSSINGEPVTAVLQTSVEVEVPTILNKSAAYDIVYAGQGTTLYWSTQQTEYCELSANGVVIDKNAPKSTGPNGYPIPANVMKPTTTFNLAPKSGSITGDPKGWNAYAKTLMLHSSFPSQAGWGHVAVEQQGQTAYICNSRTNALDIVPMGTGQVAASIPVGLGPRGVCLSVDGTTAYVSNAYADTVSVVDLANHTVTSTIPVSSPAGSAVLGGTAFVASLNSTSPAIAILNLESGTTAGSIPVEGRPFDVAVNPDGQTLYVANNAGTTVDIYDVATQAKTGSVDVKDAPTTVAISGNGASIYAGSRLGTDISVINSHITTPDLTTSVPAYLNPVAVGVSGSGQYMAAVGPTGFFVFELGLPTMTAKLMAEDTEETEES